VLLHHASNARRHENKSHETTKDCYHQRLLGVHSVDGHGGPDCEAKWSASVKTGRADGRAVWPCLHVRLAALKRFFFHFRLTPPTQHGEQTGTARATTP
jgi:hypothetical protein